MSVQRREDALAASTQSVLTMDPDIPRRRVPVVTPSWSVRLLWLVALLAAFAFRSTAPDWDAGIAAHPDERFLLGAAQSTPLPGNVCRTTPQFPYGHLPVVLVQVLVAVGPGADPLYAARLLSALVGVVLVILSGAAARTVGGRRAGLLGAALAALAPGLIQQAHFYTVDPLAAVFACGSVLAATRRRWRWAGVLTGLAVASKSSLALGALPLLALAVAAPEGPVRGLQLRGVLGWRAAEFCVPAALAFAVASPWSILTPVACWEGPVAQSLIVSGRYTVPYTQQYQGTIPFLYPLVQMALWGLGPGVVALGGVALVIRSWRARRPGSIHSCLQPAWLWTVAWLAIIGGLQVKFPRYMVPLYPWWIAWAAGLVAGDDVRRSRRLAGQLLRALLLASTGLLGLAQVGVYRGEHPWMAASGRLYRHLDAGRTIGVEAWEHPLPVPMPVGDPETYTQVTMPIYEPETMAKRRLLAAGARADVVVIATRRGYGTLSRQPSTYAETLAWYEELFAARSVEVFTRCPRVGRLAITDDPLIDAGFAVETSLAQRCGTPYALRLPRLDESFRVYDAPMTVLLTAGDE